MKKLAATLVVAILASCSRKEETPRLEPEKSLVIKVDGMQRGEGGKT